MGDINKVLGQSGAPIPLVAGDKTYLLSPITKKVQAAFESWLEAETLAEVAKIKAMAGADYFKLLAEISERIAAGHYSFNAEGGQAALSGEHGSHQLLTLILREHQPTITDDDVDNLQIHYTDEVESAIYRLVGKEPPPKKGEAQPSPSASPTSPAGSSPSSA